MDGLGVIKKWVTNKIKFDTHKLWNSNFFTSIELLDVRF